MILHLNDGLTDFNPGPLILPNSRRTLVFLKNGLVYIFYSIEGKLPERMYHIEMMNPQVHSDRQNLYTNLFEKMARGALGH